MHKTLTVAEIRCDHCLAQLPPQLGENAVLARIRAAENGWTTVSYGPPRIPIVRSTERVGWGKWTTYVPSPAEFCPGCDPLPVAAWVKLCQERYVAGDPPFTMDKAAVRRGHKRVPGVGFELVEYRPHGQPAAPARDTANLTVKEAHKLARNGRCTWTCLLAMEEICTCRCGGPYHGAAVDALRDLRAVIAAPAGALRN